MQDYFGYKDKIRVACSAIKIRGCGDIMCSQKPSNNLFEGFLLFIKI